MTEEEQLGLFPPLTAEEFNDGAGYVINGIPLIEDEDGQYVYAYGHIYRRDFAEAVTAFDREVAGYEVEETTPQDVENLWAVTIKSPGDPDGWWIRWGGVTKDTPNAFAITVVTR